MTKNQRENILLAFSRLEDLLKDIKVLDDDGEEDTLDNVWDRLSLSKSNFMMRRITEK